MSDTKQVNKTHWVYTTPKKPIIPSKDHYQNTPPIFSTPDVWVNNYCSGNMVYITPNQPIIALPEHHNQTSATFSTPDF